MIETLEKDICGSVYAVTQMTALRAVRMQARLIKLLGPSVATLFSSSSLDEAESSFSKAVSLLSENLDEMTFEKLVIDLLQGVRKNGIELTKPVIDIEFAAKLNELFLALQYVLEVNFSDFFLEGGIIGNLMKQNPAMKK